MLPYCLSTTKIPKAAVTKRPTTVSGTALCARCSRASICIAKNSSTICAKGYIQCKDACDNTMPFPCRKCGIFTTAGFQYNARAKCVDPRTMSPEELTQLELTSLLNRLKANFLKKSRIKRVRLYHITSRIIEILNPNLLLSYKKCGRLNRRKIEEHFYRTSEKFEHTFEWHKAALDFIMDRLINLDFYGVFYDDVNAEINIPFTRKNSVETINNTESFDFLNKLDKLDKLDKLSQCRDGGGINKRLRKQRTQITFKDVESFNQQLLLESYEQTIFPSEMIPTSPLILVKPTKWLTEISCPHCRLNLRLSDFSKHFAIYHCLPIVCLDVDETKRICLDPKTLLNRSAYPHTLFLVKNVVRDLGGSDYRNFFPIVLIATSICSDVDQSDQIGQIDPIDSSIEGNNANPMPNDSSINVVRSTTSKIERKHLMLWLSGIAFSKQIQVCLRVITTIQIESKASSQQQNLMINKIYPITKSQRLNDIYESDAVLSLSPETIMAIANSRIDRSIVLEISVRVANTAWVMG